MLDKIEMNLYLDFYENLLTDKQREICQYYYRQDLSISEISELKLVSRSAIHDMIQRCNNELLHYEEQLHFIASYRKRLKLYEKMQKQADPKIQKWIQQCIDTEIEGGHYE